MLNYDSGGQKLDRGHPPAIDPRHSGVFGPRTPVSRGGRVMADCIVCGRETVQDIYEMIVGRWVGLRGPSTAGKAGTRVHFRSCTGCGCLYPADDAARRYAQSKGGEFFNPARLAPQQRARAARRFGPRLAGGASVAAVILGVLAFFASPLVWGPLGLLLGISALRHQQRLGAVAIVVAALGAVAGTVLHHQAPFGYGW
jgi:hypothetical protein